MRRHPRRSAARQGRSPGHRKALASPRPRQSWEARPAATDKSPKRFRFTLVAKLQGYALDIVEDLYRANEVYVAEGDAKAAERRLEHQHSAITKMRLLGYMAQLAVEQGCILPKQYEQIAKRVHGCRNLCGAWVNADRKRLGAEPPASAGSRQGGGRAHEAQPSALPQPSRPTVQPTLFDEADG